MHVYALYVKSKVLFFDPLGMLSPPLWMQALSILTDDLERRIRTACWWSNIEQEGGYDRWQNQIQNYLESLDSHQSVSKTNSFTQAPKLTCMGRAGIPAWWAVTIEWELLFLGTWQIHGVPCGHAACGEACSLLGIVLKRDSPKVEVAQRRGPETSGNCGQEDRKLSRQEKGHATESQVLQVLQFGAGSWLHCHIPIGHGKGQRHSSPNFHCL